jgi:hypothetical protein
MCSSIFNSCFLFFWLANVCWPDLYPTSKCQQQRERQKPKKGKRKKHLVFIQKSLLLKMFLFLVVECEDRLLHMFCGCQSSWTSTGVNYWHHLSMKNWFLISWHQQKHSSISSPLSFLEPAKQTICCTQLRPKNFENIRLLLTTFTLR